MLLGQCPFDGNGAELQEVSWLEKNDVNFSTSTLQYPMQSIVVLVQKKSPTILVAWNKAKPENRLEKTIIVA